MFEFALIFKYGESSRALQTNLEEELFCSPVSSSFYLGFIVAFWGHAARDIRTSALRRDDHRVHLLGIFFEERDLIRYHGESYRHYQQNVSMIVPMPSNPKEIEVAHREARAGGV